MKPIAYAAGVLLGGLVASQVHAAADSYGPYPVTVTGYTGPKTDSVSYTGQIARHVLHTSLKKLAGKGRGGPDEALEKRMTSYYSGKSEGRPILAPTSKGDFRVEQRTVDEISKNKNLKDKTYEGLVPGLPGQMTGPEIVEFMIEKAAATSGGFDPLTGYDYPQLISKFLMGAVFYNQAVDNYLDERLAHDVKPNDRPYEEGAHYTGKEHVWDEAFGYFGAPAHALRLTPAQAHGIAKGKDPEVADANGDGMIDLVREMTFAHAYYAADADKGGSDYLHTIVGAFIDGRELIASAEGEKLTNVELAKLRGHADVIKTEWEKVIAEAAFKYAGSVYDDLRKLEIIVEANGDASDAFRDYAKHWSELKGFSMALQTSGVDLAAVAVRLNRLIGFGPVLLGGSQVTGIDADGDFVTGGERSMGEYMVHMVKVQALLDEAFHLEAKKNDVTGKMAEIIESVGESKSAEAD